jgi:signal transduction histidine kinase
MSFAPLLESKNHTLEVICPAGPLAVRADPNRLNQVLSNLLTNCIKYCPQGTRIRILARRKDGRTYFYVRDEGPGIPENQLAQLFQLFFRADTAVSRAVTGTGIGLYVSKTIVEAHGGRIGVTSQEGKYTTVHFWLPESEPQKEIGLPTAA